MKTKQDATKLYVIECYAGRWYPLWGEEGAVSEKKVVTQDTINRLRDLNFAFTKYRIAIYHRKCTAPTNKE